VKVKEPLVQIQELKKHFPIRKGLLKRQVNSVKAVDGVNLDIGRGEAVGLVGESGCGKTTLGKSVLRLIEPTSGTVEFSGEDVLAADQARLNDLRQDIQMVYQDPDASLNPRRTVKKTLVEPLKIHGQTENAEEKIDRMLDRMDLDPATYRLRFPHELSGGQRQRVGIARALMLEPDFLVLDEPTSALDVSVQARILRLLQRLQDEMGLTFLFISHDLSVVNYLCDRTAVMYLGKVVERGPTHEVFESPYHPYTQALFSSLHPVAPNEERTRVPLRGEPPSPINPPTGCAFHPRCHRQDEVGEKCIREDPELVRRADTDNCEVACHLYDPGPSCSGSSGSKTAASPAKHSSEN